MRVNMVSARGSYSKILRAVSSWGNTLLALNAYAIKKLSEHLLPLLAHKLKIPPKKYCFVSKLGSFGYTVFLFTLEDDCNKYWIFCYPSQF
jgi:hypothetical protein